VADFRGDGKLDLATGSPSGISVLLGNGDGSFQVPVKYSACGAVNVVIAGDFNGDGKLDLVGSTGDICVLLGRGDGTFGSPSSYAVGAGPRQIAAGPSTATAG